MLILAIVIALLGVVNTLAPSISERTREIGLLRPIGLATAAAGVLASIGPARRAARLDMLTAIAAE